MSPRKCRELIATLRMPALLPRRTGLRSRPTSARAASEGRRFSRRGTVAVCDDFHRIAIDGTAAQFTLRSQRGADLDRGPQLCKRAHAGDAAAWAPQCRPYRKPGSCRRSGTAPRARSRRLGLEQGARQRSSSTTLLGAEACRTADGSMVPNAAIAPWGAEEPRGLRQSVPEILMNR